jgi:hypothetical protein
MFVRHRFLNKNAGRSIISGPDFGKRTCRECSNESRRGPAEHWIFIAVYMVQDMNEREGLSWIDRQPGTLVQVFFPTYHEDTSSHLPSSPGRRKQSIAGSKRKKKTRRQRWMDGWIRYLFLRSIASRSLLFRRSTQYKKKSNPTFPTISS